MVDVFRVDVAGGALEVHRWPAADPDAPVVLAVHGITANGLSYGQIAEHLGGAVTLLAPDLRGRGGSGGLPGPYGMAAHADDLAAVLDHVGVERAVLCGHSMGAFVVCTTAVRYPSRVAGIVLVDGGVGFPMPEGTDIDAVLTAVIGPAMTRLGMTFESVDAYRDYWRVHPAFEGVWSPAVDAYVVHDLVGEPPELRSSCALEAVRVDGGALISDPEALGAVRGLPLPAVLLWATRGLQNEPQGLYDAARLAYAQLDPDRVRTQEVVDTNHYTVVIGEAGARVVARHILDAAGVPAIHCS